MKITIKHFDNEQEKREAKKIKELQEFNSLGIQFNRIPEGEYEIDEDFIFSDQYNTKATPEHIGFRVFEYCEALDNQNVRPKGYGYYIAQGIDEIRALQKTISVCGYCGKQYKNTTQEFCSACVGSEYLTEEHYKLLKLVNILDKDKFDYDKVELSKKLIDLIKSEQKKTRLRILEKRKMDKIESIQKEIQANEKELQGFTWLIEHDLDFENCIYYSHSDVFSFGWRKPLNEKEQEQIYKKMNGFPFSWEIKERK